jgi:hypothetical protein
VTTVMAMRLRKRGGCKEHDQGEHQSLLHAQTITNAHSHCLCRIALYFDPRYVILSLIRVERR